MDISNFAKAGLLYIKPEEVKKFPEAVFIITTEGSVVEKEFEGKPNPKLHLEGEWNKEKRSIDLSKTNVRAIVNVLGSDTQKWIGHQLFFEVYKTKNSKGLLVDAINIKNVN